MQNVRNHRHIKLNTHWDGRYGARELIAKPNFQSSLVIEEELVLIELNKTSVKMDIPIFIGLCILDESKKMMYSFFYDYVKTTFGDKAKLLYTDTDSLIIKFNVDDFYEFMKKDINLFDTSDYPEDKQFGLPRVNKKQLVKMKDENSGKIMTELVGLRAKLYALKVDGESVQKKAKGVTRSTLKGISFEDYKECLNEYVNIKRPQNRIHHDKFQVYTMRQDKIALSWAEDKQQLLPASYETLPWGYQPQLYHVRK